MGEIQFGVLAQYYPISAEQLEEESLLTETPGLAIREYGDHPGSFVYPGIDENGNLLSEPWDHQFDSLGYSTRVGLIADVGNQQKTIINYIELTVDLIMTDSRLLFYIKRYDKGKNYMGFSLTGLVVGGIATAVSANNAKKRNEGKVLLGQIRYEWLGDIGFCEKLGFFKPETIFFTWLEQTGIIWTLELNFRRGTGVGNMANRIAQKLSKYRLAMSGDVWTDEDRALYNNFQSGYRIPVPNVKNVSEQVFGFLPAPQGIQLRPDPNIFK